MELQSLVREVHVQAAPEIVFDVVSRTEHLVRWWPDEARFDPVAGSAGEICFGDSDAGGKVEQFTVIDVHPPRGFRFRWTHPAGEAADRGNSFLVTFELTPSGTGTLLRMTETGFRERGWDTAVLERMYEDHVHGWDLFLPRIAPYVATLDPGR